MIMKKYKMVYWVDPEHTIQAEKIEASEHPIEVLLQHAHIISAEEVVKEANATKVQAVEKVQEVAANDEIPNTDEFNRADEASVPVGKGRQPGRVKGE